jgi:hypothetical protein
LSLKAIESAVFLPPNNDSDKMKFRLRPFIQATVMTRPGPSDSGLVTNTGRSLTRSSSSSSSDLTWLFYTKRCERMSLERSQSCRRRGSARSRS